MTLADVIKSKIKSLSTLDERMDKKYREMDDNVTKDRYLRSLRREKRMIDEKYEKEHLKKVIKAEREKEVKENIWGIKDNKFKRNPKQEFKLCDRSKGLCSSNNKSSNFKGKWI